MNNEIIKINRPFTKDELGGQEDVIKINRPFTNEELGITESMSTMGIKGYAKKHPFKTALEPAAKTITGKSLLERSQEASVPGMQPTGNKVMDFIGNPNPFYH